VSAITAASGEALVRAVVSSNASARRMRRAWRVAASGHHAASDAPSAAGVLSA
jgi:hypothetical protein